MNCSTEETAKFKIIQEMAHNILVVDKGIDT